MIIIMIIFIYKTIHFIIYNKYDSIYQDFIREFKYIIKIKIKIN